MLRPIPPILIDPSLTERKYCLRTVPQLLLLRIRSAHLGIFGFLKEFVYLYNNIFARFMTMWKKQILAGAIRIQKENWGITTHFSEIIELKFGKKLPYILCISDAFLKL